MVLNASAATRMDANLKFFIERTPCVVMPATTCIDEWRIAVNRYGGLFGSAHKIAYYHVGWHLFF
jgi:hypothetical protein